MTPEQMEKRRRIMQRSMICTARKGAKSQIRVDHIAELEHEMNKPLCFVVGDSISMGYGPHLETLLAGVMKYARKSGEEEALNNLDIPVGANGGDSARVLEYLRGMAADESWRPDLLLVNCGLHDLKLQDDARQVEPDAYEANLSQIASLARNRGLDLVWVRTTPVNSEIHRREKPFDRMETDVDRYNETADRVMRGAGFAVLDLFTMTNNLGMDERITKDGVHFVPEVQRQQAAFIAGWLRAYLDGARGES